MTENQTTPPESPLVSVMVCTRDRPTKILRTVKRILASEYPNLELLVVDESDGNATAEALASLKGTPRFRFYPLAEKGKTRALNHARSLARGQYLALIDDDCDMSPDYLATLVKAFAFNPLVGVIFGDVTAGPHDPATEQIPVCPIRKAKTIRHPADFLRIAVQRKAAWLNFGMAANMSLRSAAIDAIGGWDPCIGVGSKFTSGDDHDLAFRLLRAGYQIHFCPALRVVHHGIRPLTMRRSEHKRVGRGFGASGVKHLKCGALYHGSARALVFHAARCCLELLHGRNPESASFIAGWMSGFFGGLRHPVNCRTRRFEDCH